MSERLFSALPMCPKKRACAALLGVALVCQPAFAAPDEVQRTEPMLAHAGYEREHCFQAAAGKTLVFHFETQQPVDFNIHHHPERGATTYPLRQSVAAALTQSLPIADGGEYCFTWKNPADQPAEFPITLTYSIR